eukprot:2270457-Pleurochrysis_carterae.AAC.1
MTCECSHPVAALPSDEGDHRLCDSVTTKCSAINIGAPSERILEDRTFVSLTQVYSFERHC